MGEDGSHAGWSSGQPKHNQSSNYTANGGVLRGPRVLNLRRDEGQQDFGFTLRHFIVYPPEPYSDANPEQPLGIGALCQPMDTVFVKAVRSGTPASRAGLRTGDRLIAVQNVPVGGFMPRKGLSYAEVVRFIHSAKKNLELKVVSQDYDLLQQYFAHAHAPETNQRPSMQALETPSVRRNKIGHPSPWQQHPQESRDNRALSPRIPMWDGQDSQSGDFTMWSQQDAKLIKQRQEAARNQIGRHISNATGASRNSNNRQQIPNAETWSPQHQPSVWQHQVSSRTAPSSWTGSDPIRYPQSAVPQTPPQFQPQISSTPRIPQTVNAPESPNLVNRLGPVPFVPHEQMRHAPLPYGSQVTPKTDPRVQSLSENTRYTPMIYRSPEPIYHTPQPRLIQETPSRPQSSLPENLKQNIQISRVPPLTSEMQISRVAPPNNSPRTSTEMYIKPAQFVSESNQSSTKSYPAPWNSSFQDMQLTYRPIKTTYPNLVVVPTAVKPNSIDNRRESNVSLSSTNTDISKDSLSSYESLSTVTGHETDDSVIMNRLRKSFEQKEEFLRRPSQPTGWLTDTNITNPNTLHPYSSSNSTSNAATNESVIHQKEFYARPQKLKSTMWPPNEPYENENANTNTLATLKETGNEYEKPTNGDSRRRLVSSLITPLIINKEKDKDGSVDSQNASTAEIEENDKIAFIGLQTVSHLSRQFESGRPLSPEGVPEDRTSLYRSELSRLSCKKAVPNVAVRRKEFETRAKEREREGRRRDSRSVDNSANKPPKTDSGDGSGSVGGGGGISGNRVVIFGVRIHPPDEMKEQNNQKVTITLTPSENIVPDRDTPMEPVPMRVRSHSAESQAALDSRRGRRMRPDSYIAAVAREAPVQTSISNEGIYESVSDLGVSLGSIRDAPSDLSGRMRDGRDLFEPETRPMSAPPRPTHLSLGPAILEGDGINDLSQNGVVRRRKIQSLAVEDSPMEYMKERGELDPNIMVDPNSQTLRSAHRRWRPPLFPGDIQLLRRLFEEHHAHHAPLPSSDFEPKLVDKQGLLQLKIVSLEKKRAHGRSWRPVWAQIQGSKLSFYRHTSHQTPESLRPLDLTTSSVDVAEDYTKRKNVLRLCMPGVEMLLQADSSPEMAHWVRALHLAGAKNDEAPRLFQKMFSIVPKFKKELENQEDGGVEGGAQLAEPQSAPAATSVPHKPSRKFTPFRSRSPTGQSPVNKTRKSTLPVIPAITVPNATDGSTISLPSQGSPKSKTWKGRVTKQFRKMHAGAFGGSGTQSPTSPSTEAGGCIGVPMEMCPPSINNQFVPRLVELCTTVVEERGLDVRGIYRIPGNTAAVQALTNMASRGLTEDDLQDPRWNDVNVISSLLKSYFRGLPDSLLTSDLYPMLIKADKISEAVDRLVALRTLLRRLPKHHYETLQHLMKHLKRVVEHCEINKMEARNLAIVFGPTLIRASEDNLATMVTDMSHQCRIVESILIYVDWFFSPDESCELVILPDSISDPPQTQTQPATNLLLENVTKVEAATKKLHRVFGRTKTTPSLVTPSSGSINLSSIGIGSLPSIDSKSERSSDDVDSTSNGRGHYESTTQQIRTTVTTSGGGTSKQTSHSVRSEMSTNNGSNGMMKRLKTGLTSSDKLQPLRPEHHRHSGDLSDDGSDLVSSLTSTFDMKWRMLNTPTSLKPLSGPDNIPFADESPDKPHASPKHLQNPSLHRGSGISNLTITESQRETSEITSIGSCNESDTTKSDSESLASNKETSTSQTASVKEEETLTNSIDTARSSISSGGDVKLTNTPIDIKNNFTASIIKSNTGNYNVKTQSTIPVNVVKPLASSSGFNTDQTSLSSSKSTSSNILKAIATSPNNDNDICIENEIKNENIEQNLNVNITSTQTSTSLTLTADSFYGEKSATVTVKPRHLIRSESLNKHDRNHSPISNKLKRSESLNKKDEPKLKRSESLTKYEKTQNNYKTREQSLSKSCGKKDSKLKRKNGMPSKSIKRRHTVGGTIDESHRSGRKEQVRTSSPDLNLGGCARDSFLLEVRMAPHMIAEIRLSHNFLESHI